MLPCVLHISVRLVFSEKCFHQQFTYFIFCVQNMNSFPTELKSNYILCSIFRKKMFPVLSHMHVYMYIYSRIQINKRE